MTSKRLSQFMVDYFRDSDSISVNAQWLQLQLRQLETLKRVSIKHSERLALLDALNELKGIDCPEYSLDIRG